MSRLEAGWNHYDDIEIIAEGDVYPRPRLNCAANYLEGFDTALRASGAIDGILRICMDYVSNVGYESGYLKQYLKNKQEAAEARKAKARIERLEKEAAKIEAELEEIEAEMNGDAAYDYKKLSELDTRKTELEERLLEIYEEI